MSRQAALAMVMTAGLMATAPASRAQPDDPLSVPAGTYVLDGARATLTARVSYLGGLSRQPIRFKRLEGRFVYDPANWQASRVAITVDPRVVETANSGFSRRVIRTFEPEKYPVIAFTSRRLTLVGAGQGRLAGDLSLHGVTRPVSLEVTFHGAGEGARVGFSGVGRIRRSEFGLTGGRPFVSDEVELIFEVEFVRG